MEPMAYCMAYCSMFIEFACLYITSMYAARGQSIRSGTKGAVELDGPPLLGQPPNAKGSSSPADHPLGKTLGRTTTGTGPDFLKQTLGRTATSMEPEFFRQTLARSPTGARTDLLTQTLRRADTNMMPDFLRQTLARTTTSGLFGRTLGRAATGVPGCSITLLAKWIAHGALPLDRRARCPLRLPIRRPNGQPIG